MNILRMALLSVALMLGDSFAQVASAQEPGAQKSLYDRLGGLKGITVVVDDFIDRLVANEELNKNPAIDAGRKISPAPYLKFQVSQMVCEVTGGPCKYTGKAMKESHIHLNISEKEWGVMARSSRNPWTNSMSRRLSRRSCLISSAQRKPTSSAGSGSASLTTRRTGRAASAPRAGDRGR
jgi:hemoglobin